MPDKIRFQVCLSMKDLVSWRPKEPAAAVVLGATTDGSVPSRPAWFIWDASCIWAANGTTIVNPLLGAGTVSPLGSGRWRMVPASPGVFETFEALRDYRPTVLAEPWLFAETLGYDHAGDGGAGRYWWDPDCIWPDDGGSVIDPEPTGTDGRWRLVHDGVVNVKQFGARGLGDGTDDASAIQAAFDFAQCQLGDLRWTEQSDFLLYASLSPGTTGCPLLPKWWQDFYPPWWGSSAETLETLASGAEPAWPPVSQLPWGFGYSPRIHFPPGRYAVGTPLRVGPYAHVTGDFAIVEASVEYPNVVDTGSPEGTMVLAHALTISNANNVLIRGLQFHGFPGGILVSDIPGPAAIAQVRIEDCSFCYLGEAVRVAGVHPQTTLRSCKFAHCYVVLRQVDSDQVTMENCHIRNAPALGRTHSPIVVETGRFYMRECLCVPAAIPGRQVALRAAELANAVSAATAGIVTLDEAPPDTVAIRSALRLPNDGLLLLATDDSPGQITAAPSDLIAWIDANTDSGGEYWYSELQSEPAWIRADVGADAVHCERCRFGAENSAGMAVVNSWMKLRHGTGPEYYLTYWPRSVVVRDCEIFAEQPVRALAVVRLHSIPNQVVVTDNRGEGGDDVLQQYQTAIRFADSAAEDISTLLQDLRAWIAADEALVREACATPWVPYTTPTGGSRLRRLVRISVHGNVGGPCVDWYPPELAEFAVIR